MLKSDCLRGASAVAILLGAGLTATSALAQTGEIAEVIVTGSYIRGTPEDAALPVDVLSAQDLQKQGAPSMVDIVKSIPGVQSVLGETNQFASQATTGSGNINLRGLGAVRTLVLMNGRRLASSPGGSGVDTNLLPTAAIGRIEVLKDGAAATYGSDAIGGVVNFITRTDLNGLELNGSYTAIDGSNGDYSLSANYGWIGDRGDALLSVGYRHRSELDTLERDWAVNDYLENPNGSWSGFGNPGSYVSGTTRIIDPNCTALGNTLVTAAAGTQSCYFQFGRFNNLVETEDHYQIYGQINWDLTDKIKLHAEALYASHDVPHEGTSPSYGPTQAFGPGAASGSFIIPRSNPGLCGTAGRAACLPGSLFSQLTPAQQTAVNTAGFTAANILLWRPYGVGGNPLTGGSKPDQRFFEGWRFSGGLSGEFDNGIGWDVAVTHMVNRSDIVTYDIPVARLYYALNGLGGPGCDTDPVTPGVQGGVAGVGSCLYYNPFSSGIAANAASGEVNPNFVAGSAAANANSRAIGQWLFQPYGYQSETTLTVVDAVMNGQLSIDLGGGPIGWAAGAQYRDNGFKRDVNDINNIALNPCPEENVVNCATGKGNGVFGFLGPLSEQDLDASVYAAFGELQVPITESLSLQLAVRHEEHGGDVGSTTNPKIALRWQAADWLAFRASAGTTFRAPTPSNLLPDANTTQAFITQTSGYRAFDTTGNPALKPETADTLNIGAIVRFGDFSATIDYWSFDFQDTIEAESGSGLLSTIFPNGSSTTLPNGCANPALAPLVARFVFQGGICSPAAIQRVKLTTINGTGTKTSGVDFAANYHAGDVWGGSMNFGLDGSFLLKYDSGPAFIEGIQVEAGQKLAGTHGGTAGGTSFPELRANLFAEYARDIHNLRVTLRYIDSMQDVRDGRFGGTNIFGPNGAVFGYLLPQGAKLDAFITTDVTYRVHLPWDTTATATVANLFDADPPFARRDLSYDPATANPLGRTYKLSVTKRF
ncbi:TonB-dependent siderophore receptor [Phenylobacterium sp.]|uniref:TonB-dependent receptor plug domain-containing protein n=2 Tax=Phenylobacterium sp. TaxID=1871053 RepID=UPI002731B5BC|nr:TonB-dependent receptor [Phenylobacterium sp.]MDP1601086.1 TonB-dependent receptor [Phenylobacterium sp.]